MAEGIWSLLLMNQDGKQNYENCFVFGLENSREQKKRHGRRHLYYRTTSTGLVYGCLDAMPEHAFDTARSRVQRLVLAVGSGPLFQKLGSTITNIRITLFLTMTYDRLIPVPILIPVRSWMRRKRTRNAQNPKCGGNTYSHCALRYNKYGRYRILYTRILYSTNIYIYIYISYILIGIYIQQ